MKTEEHLIKSEVLNISGTSPDLERIARYTMKLSTGTDEFDINLLETVELLRDYNNNYSDYIIATFQMHLGDFVKRVYPNRDNLFVILRHQTLGSDVTEKLEVVLETFEKNVTSGTYDQRSEDELNRDNTTVSIQCLNTTIMEMRDKVTHGIYEKCTVSDIINTVIGEELNKFGGVFGMAIGGLSMVPPDNTRVYDNIIIPKATRVIDLPKYLQQGDYGVYNGGISTYIQAFDKEETLYISPIYKHNLYGYFKESLYIVAAQREAVAGLDATYLKDGNVIKILVARDAMFTDDDSNIKNKGTGFIATEPNALTSRPVQISKDSMKISEDYVTNRQAHKEVNGKIGVVDNKGITANLYNARSEGLKRDGILIQVQWKHSNARLLKPFMPVKYVVEVNGEIKRYDGVLQRVDVTTNVSEEIEISVLTLLLQKGMSKPIIMSKLKIQ